MLVFSSAAIGIRLLDLSKMAASLGGQPCSRLPLIHALTGCGAISCFHNKGKKCPLSILKSSARYLEKFSKMTRNLTLGKEEAQQIF